MVKSNSYNDIYLLFFLANLNDGGIMAFWVVVMELSIIIFFHLQDNTKLLAITAFQIVWLG